MSSRKSTNLKRAVVTYLPTVAECSDEKPQKEDNNQSHYTRSHHRHLLHSKKRFNLTITCLGPVYVCYIFDGRRWLGYVYPSSMVLFEVELEMESNIIIWRNRWLFPPLDYKTRKKSSTKTINNKEQNYSIKQGTYSRYYFGL